MSSRIVHFAEVRSIAAMVATAMLVTHNARASKTGKLLVFLHVAVKQRALQTALQAALPDIEALAVGRVRDFERSLSDGVDAVMTLPVVLSAYKLTPQLYGSRAGSREESYSLVATGEAPDPRRVATIGALDLLGRDGTNAFVKDLLGASPHVERVTKMEDLVRLLQVQAADAVLLPTRMIAEVQATSRLGLTARELTKRVGLPAVAGTSAAGPKVLTVLSRLPAQTSMTLGVDSWR